MACTLERTLAAVSLAAVSLCAVCLSPPSQSGPAGSQDPAPTPSFHGVYPHLALFNEEGECGIGAVVPWAGKLWAITYAPHRPLGSSDGLYEIDEALRLVRRPESVGGTPACRMVHRESEQLFLGPYVIDREGQVRVIPPDRMPGRLTALARHLGDPAHKVVYATMEEGFYEVDVASLEVKELFEDANSLPDHAGPLLPGYHGKGFYTGQMRHVYANNGELSPLAQERPDVESGVLAEWDGVGDWRVVRRNQFTEVTGPGGIHGNADPLRDPVWSIGWDHRSLLLAVLDDDRWSYYRLPKASHCYDGAHGWNTEWPRIRDIGEDDLLMTMHGMFWRFPQNFRPGHTGGLAPRSSYLRVIGDFCRFGDSVVFGCDDTAKAEFLNTRKTKGSIAGPGQSQSNLWFVDSQELDHLGPVIARGSVWVDDDVEEGQVSEPFLVGGFARSGMWLSNSGTEDWAVEMEVDTVGDGEWRTVGEFLVEAENALFSAGPWDRSQWVRFVSKGRATGVNLHLFLSEDDHRGARPDPRFDGLARNGSARIVGGLVRARGDDLRTLQFASSTVEKEKVVEDGDYELDGTATLAAVDDPAARAWMAEHVAVPERVLERDDASWILIDDDGSRYRLPMRPGSGGTTTPLAQRVDREVCTERDLLHVDGTFYELPARNAGGVRRMRPIASHPFRITDYCSYRGLLVLAGVDADPAKDSSRIVRSADGRAGLWLGVVDDLWALGRPRGVGGPWNRTAVVAEERSDPYFFYGFENRSVDLSQESDSVVRFQFELDLLGDGHWSRWISADVQPGDLVTVPFVPGLGAAWIRVVTNRDCTATATFRYE